MPKESYAEIVKRTKNPVERDEAALNQIVNEKSSTDEFTDLRSAIDIILISMKTLMELAPIETLEEDFQKWARESYRIQEKLYHAMLVKEHEMFTKVFQGDNE